MTTNYLKTYVKPTPNILHIPQTMHSDEHRTQITLNFYSKLTRLTAQDDFIVL
jgi:hypothetical protein